jgi:NitT/TauT family transport system substrate-binding protein
MKRIVLAGMLILALLLAACVAPATTAPAGEATAPAAEDEAAAAAPTELQTIVWVSPRGSLEVMDDVNLWVAQELGYFAEMGLDVQLEPGPLEALAVTKLVAEGQADVGYPSPGVLLASLDAGMPLIQPWEMMLGQTFNFAVQQGSDIKSVQDLEGKKISLGSEGWKVIVDPILVEAGVDPASVEYVNAGNQWAQAVAAGEADAALAWRGLTPQWSAVGLNFDYIFGTDFSSHPSNGYAIRKADLEDPAMREMWEKFFRGNAMGFEFTRLNPRAAAQIVYEKFPALQEQMTPQLAFDSMVELTDLYLQSWKNGDGYGYNDIANWQAYIDTVFELGQITTDYPAEEVVTNELIEAANDFDAERVAADAAAYELNEDWAAISADSPWSE